MINNLFKILFFLLLSDFLKAQVATNMETHDKASQNIADVLFDSKAKPIRERAKAFENVSGIKIQFKVEEQSLDQLGGLSEHLFRLFQNFTTNENTNAKTITAEFSALSDQVLSDVLTYKTNVTNDLANCALPPTDTHKLDSLYNKGLHGNSLSPEEINVVPTSLDGIYAQSIGDYENILYKNSNCPGTVDESSYMQQVINTRQNRFSSWTSDVNALSLNISINFGLLSSDTSSANSNNTFQGKHIINLNSSVNSCTEEDMESRCRMLFGKTHKRFLFVTQTINYYLPLDSLSAFRDAATQTFSNNSTDEVIVALYLNMKSIAAEKSTAIVLVKQVNGDWLTAGDINFANHNNGGKYNEGTFYKFKNLYKNIPKPLILCYQVAKVNGLLTTAYFNKGAVVKGREQIYYHIFKLDKALDEIKQLDEQRKTKIAAIGNANGLQQALNASNQLDEIVNKIKITYLEAAKNPSFREAGEHFKDLYIQKKEIAEAAALQYLKENYGALYPNNQIETLLANVELPADVKMGSCKTSANSDVIGDGLNIASLVLSPTGLDFIPDALAVAYFASTDNTIEMFWASASFIVPGSLSGARKIVNNSADAIKEINAGSKLLIESQQLKVIEQDVNYITSAFNIKPQDVDPSLLGKIRDNPTVTSNLLPITSAQAKVYSNTEKLAAPKRIEFVKKCYDDPDFRQKVLADPDEVLKWGGIVDDFAMLLAKQKKRLESLKNLYGNLDFDNFATIGGKTTSDITSSMYNEMISELSSRSNWDMQKKIDKVVEILGSGNTAPQKVTYQQGTELFKIVRKGNTPSPTTEYWVTKSQLDQLISTGTNFESKSGLPLGSIAEEYDIYKITANSAATTYQSIIAPTIQKGYTSSGGSIQTLVLNRSAWSIPEKFNTNSFIPNL